MYMYLHNTSQPFISRNWLVAVTQEDYTEQTGLISITHYNTFKFPVINPSLQVWTAPWGATCASGGGGVRALVGQARSIRENTRDDLSI